MDSASAEQSRSSRSRGQRERFYMNIAETSYGKLDRTIKRRQNLLRDTVRMWSLLEATKKSHFG